MLRERAELLIRGSCRAAWKTPDYNLNDQSLLVAYHDDTVFTPTQYEEELMLLLLVSEELTSNQVLLERSAEFEETRIQSLNDVLWIQDLFTIVFTPFKQYSIDNYEKAMKFSYEVKQIWFQFALTLIENDGQSLRAFLTLQEVSRIDSLDPLPNLLAAKLCMSDLKMFNKAVELLKDALLKYQQIIPNDNNNHSEVDPSSLVNNIKEIYGGSNLSHRIHLLLGIANALVYEYDYETSNKNKKEYLKDSLNHLNEAIKLDESGTDHLPYFHIGLHMANQRSLNDAIKYSRVSLLLHPNHLPTIELLILALSGKRLFQEALELCEATLLEFPDHLMFLYIKANLQEVFVENGRAEALKTTKQLLKQWREIKSKEVKFSAECSSCINTKTSKMSLDTISLRMEQALTEVISLENSSLVNHDDNLSNKSRGSNLPCSIHSNSKAFEMQIWLTIIELFLKLDQISEAENCIDDDAVDVFHLLSHQLMYVKGLISKKKQQWHDAKKYFENAVSVNPNHAKALQQLGYIHYILENLISAEKYLQDSLNFDSNLHETWSYLGLVHDANNEYERAANCHANALELEKTCPLLPFNLISRSVFL